MGGYWKVELQVNLRGLRWTGFRVKFFVRWRIGLCEVTEGWNLRFVGLVRSCAGLNSL